MGAEFNEGGPISWEQPGTNSTEQASPPSTEAAGTSIRHPLTAGGGSFGHTHRDRDEEREE